MGDPLYRNKNKNKQEKTINEVELSGLLNISKREIPLKRLCALHQIEAKCLYMKVIRLFKFV